MKITVYSLKIHFWFIDNPPAQTLFVAFLFFFFFYGQKVCYAPLKLVLNKNIFQSNLSHWKYCNTSHLRTWVIASKIPSTKKRVTPMKWQFNKNAQYITMYEIYKECWIQVHKNTTMQKSKRGILRLLDPGPTRLTHVIVYPQHLMLHLQHLHLLHLHILHPHRRRPRERVRPGTTIKSTLPTPNCPTNGLISGLSNVDSKGI